MISDQFRASSSSLSGLYQFQQAKNTGSFLQNWNILSDNISFDPVGSLAFRVDDIKFDQILSGIRKFTSRLALEEQMKIHTSWDNLRHTLESLPGKIDNLKKMNITDLPQQREQNDMNYTDVSFSEYIFAQYKARNTYNLSHFNN